MYLVVTHSFTPKFNVATHVKGYMSPDTMNTNEEIRPTMNLNKHDKDFATFIIDVKNMTVVKNRYRDQHSDETILNHYLNEYMNQSGV